MDTPQNQQTPQSTPAANTTGTPGAGFGGDLYAAITAADETPVVVEKKHQSPFILLVAAFMKLTFWVDSTRRNNESAFRVLNKIWCTFIGILYLSGVITLFLCLTSFVSLPARIERFFEENNIKYASLEMVDYSLTQIDITDLHDEKNTYQIPVVHIRSTFSDFLKNKILGVEAEGVKVNLDPSKTGGNDLGWLMSVFSAFNQNNSQKLSINALNISKAVLNIMGKKITLPIAFSVVGDYGQGTKTTAILFNINEDFLSAEGNLSISGEGAERNVEITIKSGTLRLPASPEEELNGKINLSIANKDIRTVEGTLNLTYAHTERELKLNAQKEEAGFSGDLSYLVKNNAANATEEVLMDMLFTFKNVQIDGQQNLTTQEPLKITINRLYQNNLLLSGVEATLNGKLACAVSDGKCEYELDKKSDLSISVAKKLYKEQQIIFNDNRAIELYPKGKTSFLWQLNPFTFKLDLNVKNIDSYGYLNDEKKELDLLLPEVGVTANLSLTDNILGIDIKRGHFVSPTWELDNIALTSNNIFDSKTPLKMTAEHVKTNSKLLKQSFDLDLTALGEQSLVDIKVDGTDIRLQAKGALDPVKGTFVGKYVLSPVQLEKLKMPLSEISDLFAPEIKDVSGQFIAKGQVKFLGNNTIMGPMYLGLKNINFKLNETAFVNLNSVIGLQALRPVQSSTNQPLYIEEIKSSSSLYNLMGSFQLNNKNIKFNNLEGNVANQKLFLNTAIVPLDNPSGLFYFKSDDTFKTNEITPYVDLSGIKLSDGKSSLAVGLSIAPKAITIPSVTLKVNDGALTPKKEGKDILGLFTKGQTRYFVRNGVFTLTKQNNLQAEVDGWYLPYSQKKSLSQKDIILVNPMFKGSSQLPMPKNLEQLLGKLFP